MVVNIMRVDDRLIHGQIVTAWLREANADSIIVADNLAAKDSMQEMLLKLATPGNVKLYIKNIEDAAKFLEKDEGKSLLLVRNPKAANELFDLGFKIDKINIGNISNSKSETGRKTLLSYIHVEEQDIKELEKIRERGIKLDVRSIPSDKSNNGESLLKKYKE